MDNKELIAQIFKQYGISGLLTIFLIYKHYVEPRKEEREVEKKKNDGTYISWESLDERLTRQMKIVDDVKDKQDILNDRLNDGLEKESEKQATLSELKSDHKNFKEKIVSDIGHIFNQHKTLFEKIDKIDEKIDQRFLVINQDIKEVLKEMRK